MSKTPDIADYGLNYMELSFFEPLLRGNVVIHGISSGRNMPGYDLSFDSISDAISFFYNIKHCSHVPVIHISSSYSNVEIMLDSRLLDACFNNNSDIDPYAVSYPDLVDSSDSNFSKDTPDFDMDDLAMPAPDDVSETISGTDEFSFSQKGRPEWGRKLTDASGSDDDNRRKSRSVWSTVPENRFLIAALDAFKNDPNWRVLTLGKIFSRLQEQHDGYIVTDGALDPAYRDRISPSALVSSDKLSDDDLDELPKKELDIPVSSLDESDSSEIIPVSESDEPDTSEKGIKGFLSRFKK